MKITHTKLLCLVGALAIPATGFAQDPLAAGKAKKVDAPETLHLVYETFSLPMSKAAALLRAGHTDEQFYEKMTAGLKDKSVKQEVFQVGRFLSGQLSTVENIAEYIYPTEGEPPELPNAVNGTSLKTEEGVVRGFPVTPATPSAFDTKNLGNTLEVEATGDGFSGYMNLRIAPTTITFIRLDSYGQGLSEFKMPRFSAQKINTQITIKSGQASFLGSMSPPAELQPKDGEQLVWFAFATVSIVVQ